MKLTQVQIVTLVGLCERRTEKLDTLDNIEAAILEQKNNAKALVFLWALIRRNYGVGETIVMSEQEWAAFAKVSKSMVKPLLTVLTKKLGALVQLQRGKVGSSSGRASKYKRLV